MFYKEESNIQYFWTQNEVKPRWIAHNKNGKKKIFYEGPPFATGTPHYGHLNVLYIKDTVTRYLHQIGYNVTNKPESYGIDFGWDCHGLPIEYEIDKKFNIKTKQEVLNFGIDKYCKECENIVMTCADDWKETMNKVGRWVNMETPYKTMDLSYMNSVWSVFSKLYKDELIYKGYKIMPYSTGCFTPLSNFEAKSNYQKVTDQSVIVRFKVNDKRMINFCNKENGNIYLLVWTTTPWTLLANQKICVNPKLMYVICNVKGDCYIVSEKYAKENKLEIHCYIRGNELYGLEYNQLLDNPDAAKNKFEVLQELSK